MVDEEDDGSTVDYTISLTTLNPKPCCVEPCLPGASVRVETLLVPYGLAC